MYTHLFQCLKLKRLNIKSVGEVTEHMECSYAPEGDGKFHNYLLAGSCQFQNVSSS